MSSHFQVPPWGFSRGLLELPEPDAFHEITVDVKGRKEPTTVREYRLAEGTAIMIDHPVGELISDIGAAAHDAWRAAGGPVPFRTVWHSYQSWGDCYEEDHWVTGEQGSPIVDSSEPGVPRFTFHSSADSADELMLMIAGEL